MYQLTSHNGYNTLLSFKVIKVSFWISFNRVENKFEWKYMTFVWEFYSYKNDLMFVRKVHLSFCVMVLKLFCFNRSINYAKTTPSFAIYHRCHGLFWSILLTSFHNKILSTPRQYLHMQRSWKRVNTNLCSGMTEFSKNYAMDIVLIMILTIMDCLQFGLELFNPTVTANSTPFCNY